MTLSALLTAVLLAQAAASLDTVFLANGGRLRGTIVEDDPAVGVTILMPDGTMRRLVRAQIARVAYAQQPPRPSAPAEPPTQGAPSSVAPPAAPSPPPPPQGAPPAAPGPPPAQAAPPTPPPELAPPPPPQQVPPPPQQLPPPPQQVPPAPPQQPPASPAQSFIPPPPRNGFTGSVGFQYALGGGRVMEGVGVHDTLPVAVELEAQAGFKLWRRFFFGVYVSGGPAVPGRDTVDACHDLDITCKGSSGRVGLMARVDISPAAAWNPWVGLGAGAESHKVDVVRTDIVCIAAPCFTKQELKFSGGEFPRLMAGVDYRSGRTFGFGFFAAASAGRYDKITSDGGPNLVDDRSLRTTHGWITLGVRGVVFP